MNARVMTLLTVLLTGAALTPTAPAWADDAKQEKAKRELDKEVQGTLQRFRTQVKGAPEVLQSAKAVLVIPDVKKVGLVGGGEWGKGALRMNGENVAYYKMRGGSVGLQAGYEEGDMVFVFFTDEAVNKFKAENQFEVSAEAGVTMVDKDADVSAPTLKKRSEIAGFAFSNEGLMAGASVKGTKFERVNPK